MNTYYITFSTSHPLGDGWIEVTADSAELARAEIVKMFGTNWAFMYEDADFDPAPFPLGRFGRQVEVL